MHCVKCYENGPGLCDACAKEMGVKYDYREWALIRERGSCVEHVWVRHVSGATFLIEQGAATLLRGAEDVSEDFLIGLEKMAYVAFCDRIELAMRTVRGPNKVGPDGKEIRCALCGLVNDQGVVCFDCFAYERREWQLLGGNMIRHQSGVTWEIERKETSFKARLVCDGENMVIEHFEAICALAVPAFFDLTGWEPMGPENATGETRPPN